MFVVNWTTLERHTQQLTTVPRPKPNQDRLKLQPQYYKIYYDSIGHHYSVCGISHMTRAICRT
ncbi:hypothetical protein J6590_076187 [Homalodisca vitripennis]|nr:hypothetical protein J6590_076187 [Homalodisca vitripennis]